MHESVDEQFFAQCAHEYSLSLISALVDHYGSDCAPDAALLSSILEHPIAAEYSPFWGPELGQCLNALKTNKLRGAQRGLTQIVLNLLAAGIPGKWEIDLVEPIHFRWDSFFLPQAQRLEIDSDGLQARINVSGLDSNHTLYFNAVRNSRLDWHSDNAEKIAYLEMGENRALLLSGRHCAGLGLPDPVLPGVETVTERHKQHMKDAFIFIDNYFPTWKSWHDRVVRAISIGQKAPEGIHSGTVEGYFGLLSISDSEDVLKVTESIIHEASHQYFFLLSRLVALTNDDEKLFYSPFTNSHRPSDRILLAYHAFTNVEMFYKECVKLGIDGNRCGPVLAQLRRELGEVQRTLSTEVELTQVGQCMFDSLLAYRHSYGIYD